MTEMANRAAWLQGPGARCSPQPEAEARPLRIVMLGAPGVGKGTQAAFFTERRKVCQLSTGDMLRFARNAPPCQRTPALEEAFRFMERGELVPDRTVVDLVKERIDCLRCSGGFLLDGFPRTVGQAEALAAILAAEHLRLDAVLNFEMALDQIVARLAGRRTCSGCSAVYHVEARPPRQPGTCDQCGSPLVQREDDRPEAIRVRMATYERKTACLIDYYRRAGLLVSVMAEGTPEEIYGRACQALETQIAITAR